MCPHVVKQASPVNCRGRTCIPHENSTNESLFFMPQADVATPFLCLKTPSHLFFVRLCCPRPGLQEQSGWFTHVFVDEAAQGMEPEALIPLTLARPDATGIAQVLGGKMVFLQFARNKPADVVFCLLTEFVERA